MIRIKRIYEPVETGDGRRFLVERLWPRGMRKEESALESWFKEIAPTTTLRQWFGHDPARWEEFRLRYRAELETNRETVAFLLEAARGGAITLVYSARDQEHNSALLLKEYLEERLPVP